MNHSTHPIIQSFMIIGEALKDGYMEGYFVLAEQFRVCCIYPSTLTMVCIITILYVLINRHKMNLHFVVCQH